MRRVVSRRACRLVSRRVVSCGVARWGVLRCIVMCSVVMCCVVSRCVALCCAALRFDAARCAALCCGGACALRGGMLSRVALRCVVPYSVALQCVVLRRALLRYVVRYCVDLVLRIWPPRCSAFLPRACIKQLRARLRAAVRMYRSCCSSCGPHCSRLRFANVFKNSQLQVPILGTHRGSKFLPRSCLKQLRARLCAAV